MVFGSVGGDQQDQWQLQFFLNCVLFKMTVQEAIEAPKLSSDHFPGFFAPHDRFPNKVRIEPRVSRRIIDILSAGDTRLRLLRSGPKAIYWLPQSIPNAMS